MVISKCTKRIWWFVETEMTIITTIAFHPSLIIQRLSWYYLIQKKWKVKHFNFQSPFPNGKLDCTVHAELTKHLFTKRKRKFVVKKLQRSLYGLKDASRIWFKLINSSSKAAGTKEMKNAPCVVQGNSVIAVCYFDDLLVFVDINDKIDELENKLSGDLIMKDLGIPRSFLGIELGRQKETVYLSQKGPVKRLLEDKKMAESKAMTKPMNANPEPRKEDEQMLDERDATRYRGIVDSLLHIAMKNRQDICVSASSLGAHVESTHQAALVAVKRALQYLKGAFDRSLMDPGRVNQICTFIDFNWDLQHEKNRRKCTRVYVR